MTADFPTEMVWKNGEIARRGVSWRNLRFVGFGSAGEIGIDVFFRERHELLLLSEEFIETHVHRYVQYRQGWWRRRRRMYKERKSDASDLK